MISPSQSKTFHSRTMKEINDERRTGLMVIPVWIEISWADNLNSSLLEPVLSVLNPSLLGDRRAKEKKRKAKIVMSALVKAILDGDDGLVFFQRNRGNYNKHAYPVTLLQPHVQQSVGKCAGPRIPFMERHRTLKITCTDTV